MPVQPPSTAYVSFHAPITSEAANALAKQFQALNGQGFDEIHLLMSSGGGDFDVAITLYNFLRALPINLVTHNLGTVESAAVFVFLAGTKRHAASSASFLFHAPSASAKDGSTVSPERLEAAVANARARMSCVLTEHLVNVDTSVASPLLLQNVYKSSEDAKHIGLVHSIMDAKIPRGAPHVHIAE